MKRKVCSQCTLPLFCLCLCVRPIFILHFMSASSIVILTKLCSNEAKHNFFSLFLLFFLSFCFLLRGVKLTPFLSWLLFFSFHFTREIPTSNQVIFQKNEKSKMRGRKCSKNRNNVFVFLPPKKLFY